MLCPYYGHAPITSWSLGVATLRPRPYYVVGVQLDTLRPRPYYVVGVCGAGHPSAYHI